MTKSVAYFDCQFGAAGDMLVAALLDASLDEAAWLSEVKKIALPTDSYKIEIHRVQRCTLAAKKMDVIVKEGAVVAHNASSSNWVREQGEPAGSQGDMSSHSHSHDHDHSHAHAHAHAHNHPHEHDHEHHHHQGRNHTHGEEHQTSHRHDSQTPIVAMSYIQEIIRKSEISEKAKQLAQRIIARLGRCESAVHGMNQEAVIFHEVGAIDTIVDIIGFAIAYDMLGIEQSFVSAVPMGRGHVKTAHGIFPIPAPAVALMLAECKAPIIDYEIDFECLTPTAVAILAEICSNWGVMPKFEEMHAVGYGAGNKNPGDHPNVSRVMLGAGIA